MSIFKSISKISLEPANEGWGLAFTIFSGMGAGAAVGATLGYSTLGPVGAAIAAPVSAGVGAKAGLVAHAYFSSKFLDKAISNPKLIKYLKSQCDNFYNEEKKKNHDITNVIPKNLVKYKSQMAELSHQELFNKALHKAPFNSFNHTGLLKRKIIKYDVWIAYDATHIQAVMVFFYDTKKDKIFKRSIPAPSDKELKYYRE